MATPSLVPAKLVWLLIWSSIPRRLLHMLRQRQNPHLFGAVWIEVRCYMYLHELEISIQEIVLTKIDVHAGTLSMEFGDTLVQFNIFEAMKHPTKDHSLFGIDLIDELVEEYFQLDSHNEDIDNFAERTDSINCLGS
ncbi:hypothetical protein CR513_01977, partial [Mucuna pruriens]